MPQTAMPPTTILEKQENNHIDVARIRLRGRVTLKAYCNPFISEKQRQEMFPEPNEEEVAEFEHFRTQLHFVFKALSRYN